MSKCGSCCGNCGGCGGAMELTAGEIRMLLKLAEIPFLPVARKMSDDIPVYLEDTDETMEQYSLILQCLEKRGLISIDTRVDRLQITVHRPANKVDLEASYILIKLREQSQ